MIPCTCPCCHDNTVANATVRMAAWRSACSGSAAEYATVAEYAMVSSPPQAACRAVPMLAGAPPQTSQLPPQLGASSCQAWRQWRQFLPRVLTAPL